MFPLRPDGDSETCLAEEDDDSCDWQVEQEPYREVDISPDGPKYGFANKRCGVFKRLKVIR
jgi:hypothetical protein